MRVERIQSRTLFRANMYVLEDDGETGLVDACFGPGYRRLARVLDGRRPSWLLLTHWHLDHVAWLARIVADYRIPVCCAGECADYITGAKRWSESRFYREAGPWWLKPFWGTAFRLWPIPLIEPGAVQVVAPGDTLSLGGQRWQVVGLEGHTPGSLGLYHAERGVLFCGDAAFRRRDGRIRRASYHYSVDRARVDATFARVQAMGLRYIYPGHYSCGVVRQQVRHAVPLSTDKDVRHES